MPSLRLTSQRRSMVGHMDVLPGKALYNDMLAELVDKPDSR